MPETGRQRTAQDRLAGTPCSRKLAFSVGVLPPRKSRRPRDLHLLRWIMPPRQPLQAPPPRPQQVIRERLALAPLPLNTPKLCPPKNNHRSPEPPPRRKLVGVAQERLVLRLLGTIGQRKPDNSSSTISGKLGWEMCSKQSSATTPESSSGRDQLTSRSSPAATREASTSRKSCGRILRRTVINQNNIPDSPCKTRP